MIYLGIQLLPNAFKMTALSSNFALLTSGASRQMNAAF